jgi:hypothetical protein
MKLSISKANSLKIIPGIHTGQNFFDCIKKKVVQDQSISCFDQ